LTRLGWNVLRRSLQMTRPRPSQQTPYQATPAVAKTDIRPLNCITVAQQICFNYRRKTMCHSKLGIWDTFWDRWPNTSSRFHCNTSFFSHNFGFHWDKLLQFSLCL
jgi:hypothetical protein